MAMSQTLNRARESRFETASFFVGSGFDSTKNEGVARCIEKPPKIAKQSQFASATFRKREAAPFDFAPHVCQKRSLFRLSLVSGFLDPSQLFTGFE